MGQSVLEEQELQQHEIHELQPAKGCILSAVWLLPASQLTEDAQRRSYMES